jgi:hypothetical protein
LETASADKNWWDFSKIFARGHRYRISLAFMVSVYGQLSGNGLITCRCRGSGWLGLKGSQ